MARIYIEPTKAKRSVQDAAALERTLNSLSQEVGRIRSKLRYKISGREQISERLREVSQQISKEATSTRALSNGLQQIIARYEQVERANRDHQVADKASTRKWTDPISRWFENSGLHPWDPAEVWPTLRPLLIGELIQQAVLPFFPPATLPTIPISLVKFLAQDDEAFSSDIFSWKSADKLREEKVKLVSNAKTNMMDLLKDDNEKIKALDDWKKANTRDLGSAKYFIDTKTGEITKIDPNDESAKKEFSEHNKGTLPIDVRLAGIGTSSSLKAWEKKGDLSGNIGGLEGSVAAGKAEYHADAYAGLLGVGATIGASATAFSAEGKAYLGNDDAQLYLKGGVDVGRVGAQAGASVGLIDKDGEFNPNAYLNASAELIGGEVSGSVGAKIAGTDVALKGSLNYGLGAHANVGMHDGKISVDIGASVGVGVGVKLDVDVSGTVKAIGEAAHNVRSFLENLF